MKRSISLLLAIVMIASLALVLPRPARAAEQPFGDVPDGTWYTDAVAYVYRKGWIDGTGPSTFEPETYLTRAQLVTILWRIAGKPAVSGALPYTDVAADTWYTEAVRWAAAEERYIVEDDFESEFSLLRKPEETVFSQSKKENVIYLNTFSRTVSPSVRVGYMVLPPRMIPLFQETVGFYSCTVPAFEQYVLAQLMDNGDFERHINRIRRMERKKLSAKG